MELQGKLADGALTGLLGILARSDRLGATYC